MPLCSFYASTSIPVAKLEQSAAAASMATTVPARSVASSTATTAALSLHLPELPSRVKDKILSLELMGVDYSDSEQQQVEAMASMAAEVVAPEVFDRLPRWDEDYIENTHEDLLQQLALGMDGENKKDSAHVFDAMSIQEVAQEVCDDRCGKVVWDEEMSSELSMNNDLLRVLDSGGKYLVDEQVLDGSSGFMDFGLVDADHIFVEELDQDSKPFCKGVLSQQLALGAGYSVERMSNKVAWDEDRSQDSDLCHGLLEQLAAGEDYKENARNEHILSDLETQDQTMCADHLSDEKMELTNMLDQDEVFDDLLCQATLKHANIAHNLELYGSYITDKVEDLGGSNAISVLEELNNNLSYTDQLQEFLTIVLHPFELCMGSSTYPNLATQVMVQIKDNSEGTTALVEMSVRM